MKMKKILLSAGIAILLASSSLTLFSCGENKTPPQDITIGKPEEPKPEQEENKLPENYGNRTLEEMIVYYWNNHYLPSLEYPKYGGWYENDKKKLIIEEKDVIYKTEAEHEADRGKPYSYWWFRLDFAELNKTIIFDWKKHKKHELIFIDYENNNKSWEYIGEDPLYSLVWKYYVRKDPDGKVWPPKDEHYNAYEKSETGLESGWDSDFMYLINYEKNKDKNFKYFLTLIGNEWYLKQTKGKNVWKEL